MQVVKILPYGRPRPYKLTVNTMATNELVTQGARASAAIVLPYFTWNIWVSAPTELTVCVVLIVSIYDYTIIIQLRREI